jgi:DNA-binding transcriptional MerR regulator
MPDAAYSLPDLCGLADVTPRTVRYYIAQGLLRSPGTSGSGARYDDGHLARLRLIRRLQREHLPLAEIRARLAALTDGDAIAQAEGPAELPADSALDYIRGVLGGGVLRASPGTMQKAAPPAGAVMSLAPPAMDVAAPEVEAPAASDRSHWERYTLAPDVELHVRRPLTRSQNRAVARLVETAHQLLEEDQP